MTICPQPPQTGLTTSTSTTTPPRPLKAQWNNSYRASDRRFTGDTSAARQRRDAGESIEAAARRELAEETGYRGDTWTSHGAVWPMPGLTPARVHLWSASGLEAGTADLEDGEADLQLRRVPLGDAVDAVRTGLLRCAASASLVLALAADGAYRRGFWKGRHEADVARANAELDSGRWRL